jgi:hypothetical protein
VIISGLLGILIQVLKGELRHDWNLISLY